MSGEGVELTEAEREALRTSGSWPNVGRDLFAAVQRIIAAREATAARDAAYGRATMTPTEHYWEAERLIEVGETVALEIREATTEERRDALGKQAMGVWAQAQVHATLALHPGGA